MNTERRVLIVARHYSPTTSDPTLRLRAWVQGLATHGFAPQVLTPRWHSTWPRRVVCEEIPVTRLDFPPTSHLRVSRYWRSLTDWVNREVENFDGLYCDAADGDAHAILSQLPKRSTLPVIVRFDPRELIVKTAGLQSAPWQPSPRTVDACRRATTVLAPTATAHQTLLAMGIDNAKIQRITDGTHPSIVRARTDRSAARQILASINHDLFVRSQDNVIVCPGELTREWGIDLLIQALGPIVERERAVKLWILGDGVERSRIYEALQYQGLHRLVAMPGNFTCLEHILQVADLCVFPAADQGLGWLIPTCIANAIPLVTADSPDARSLLGSEASRLSFHAGEPQALRDWVVRWLRSPNIIETSVHTARNASLSTYDAESSLRVFAKLFNPAMSHPVTECS